MRGIRELWRPRVVGRSWTRRWWCSAQPGPRERSSRRATMRSPSRRSESAPSSAMSGSEPGSSQVGVPEGAQRHVFGTGGAQGHRPCLLSVLQAQRDRAPARPRGCAPGGSESRDLAADDLSVLAAGHERDAVGVAREFEGERLQGRRWSRGGSRRRGACARRCAAASRPAAPAGFGGGCSDRWRASVSCVFLSESAWMPCLHVYWVCLMVIAASAFRAATR